MAEIMLAPGRYDLKNTKDLLVSRLEKIYGVKILINDSYIFGATDPADTRDLDRIKNYGYRYGRHDRIVSRQQQTERSHARYGAVACYLRESGASRVMIDAKTPNDKPKEMLDITNSIIAGYMPSSPVKRKLHVTKSVPDFQTVHYSAGRASMSAFIETVGKHGVEPVCFTTSSMFEEQDYVDLCGSSSEFVKRSTDVISELGFRAVLIAARDAELVRSINPELTIIATGGLLTLDEETDHQRTALFEDTREFVDVYAIGSPILQARNPEEAFDERYLAVH